MGRDERGNLGKTVHPQIKPSVISSCLPTLPKTEIWIPKVLIMIADDLLEENHCETQRWQWEPQAGWRRSLRLAGRPLAATGSVGS